VYLPLKPFCEKKKVDPTPLTRHIATTPTKIDSSGSTSGHSHVNGIESGSNGNPHPNFGRRQSIPAAWRGEMINNILIYSISFFFCTLLGHTPNILMTYTLPPPNSNNDEQDHHQIQMDHHHVYHLIY
jgi:hypothetical protein